LHERDKKEERTDANFAECAINENKTAADNGTEETGGLEVYETAGREDRRSCGEGYLPATRAQQKKGVMAPAKGGGVGS